MALFLLSLVDEPALPVRRVKAADHAAARMWIDNWQRMLPYVVAIRALPNIGRLAAPASLATSHIA
ncbi:hypothetical protein F3J17_10885 [Burkholderia sp. Ax-1719]|nr:hypothetical protein [Burkholderia sp. Ax-1719]